MPCARGQGGGVIHNPHKISSTLCDSGLRDRATALRQEIARREQEFTGLDRDRYGSSISNLSVTPRCRSRDYCGRPRMRTLGDCLSRDGFRNPVSIGARTRSYNL